MIRKSGIPTLTLSVKDRDPGKDLKADNYSETMAELVPMRWHPRAINASISALFFIPPDAFILTFGPICFLNNSMSSGFAPPDPKPVEVLIKSAPPSVTHRHNSIFSVSVR